MSYKNKLKQEFYEALCKDSYGKWSEVEIEQHFMKLGLSAMARQSVRWKYHDRIRKFEEDRQGSEERVF